MVRLCCVDKRQVLESERRQDETAQVNLERASHMPLYVHTHIHPVRMENRIYPRTTYYLHTFLDWWYDKCSA